MTSTVRIRVGEVEVEYSGAHDYSHEELGELLTTVTEIVVDSGGSIPSTPLPGTAAGAGGAPAASAPASSTAMGTTNTIAAKLNVDSGPELIIAACARLTLGLGKDQFDRREITREMRNGQGYFKRTYVNNMTKYLQRCVSSDELREVNTGVYSLSHKKRQELEVKLAD